MGHYYLRVLGILILVSTFTEVSYAEGSKRFGLALFGGYSTYSMSDIDDALAEPGTFFPGATVTADDIGAGAGFGAGLRMWRSDRVMVSIDVSRLLAKTDGSAVYLGTPFDGELNVPATNVGLTVNYLFPSNTRSRWGLGAGAGYYTCTGEASASGSGVTFSADVEGSGFGFHALGIGDIALSDAVNVEIGAGYRLAKTTDVQVDGGVLYNADGSKSQVDWSGFMSRLGVTFYLGGKKE